jgi:hypothetical protein
MGWLVYRDRLQRQTDAGKAHIINKLYDYEKQDAVNKHGMFVAQVG